MMTDQTENSGPERRSLTDLARRRKLALWWGIAVAVAGIVIWETVLTQTGLFDHHSRTSSWANLIPVLLAMLPWAVTQVAYGTGLSAADTPPLPFWLLIISSLESAAVVLACEYLFSLHSGTDMDIGGTAIIFLALLLVAQWSLWLRHRFPMIARWFGG